MFSKSSEAQGNSEIAQHIAKVDAERDHQMAYGLRSIAETLRHQARHVASIPGLDAKFREDSARALVEEANILTDAADELDPQETKQETGDNTDAFGNSYDPRFGY